MLQVTVCVIVLVMAVALKFVDKETFQDFKNWYNFKLNETLKVGSMQNDCDSLLKFFFNEISKEDHLNQG